MRSHHFIFVLIVFSCRENSRVSELKTNGQDVDTISSNSIIGSPKRQRPGLIWSSDNIKVYGDTTIDKSKIDWVSTKFAPYISFDDFLAERKAVEGRKANLDWKSNKGAKRFKTRIESAYEKDEAHFAGHYVVAYWGCGSPCQSGVIIDRENGKIFDLPAAALGYDFKETSRMLIVNKPDSLGFYDDCVYCKPEIYIWNEDREEFIARRPELK